MAMTLIPAGITLAGKALLKTPAGRKAIESGGKAVRNFLGKKAIKGKPNKKFPSTGAKTPAAKGNRTAPNKPKEMDARNILKKREKYETNMTKEQRAAAVKKARGEAVRNARGQRANRFGYEGLKAGGEVEEAKKVKKPTIKERLKKALKETKKYKMSDKQRAAAKRGPFSFREYKSGGRVDGIAKRGRTKVKRVKG